MNKKARSNLRKVVTQARQLLEEDIKTQLKRLGIEESGKTIPAGRLTHLRREDKDLRDKILAAIQKEQVRKVERGEAYDRYIRHVGFTYLNRLAALRAMEVRELIKETVIRRDQYAGMSRREYEVSEREGLSDHAEVTRKSLLEAFNKVSQEIKVLFDVNDEYSLLFPSHRTLDKVMSVLGEEVPEEDWREEDIIGWIYQYYNSETRSEFRKKRRKPRPDDVPVINQFYTPRWLVRALVDNTLGRLWLEMKGRMPKPGQAEAPSEERLRNPQGETVDEYCSYLIPLRQEPPPRKEKSVREIKVLDPACGSGHFLIYAFNVLYRMYLENETEIPREEIPRLILENNLFGIDIDLRSVQLAALSLFLKAKEYNRDVKIGRMNLVCADVRITDGDLQREFISRLEPDVDLQRIFVKLFKELEFTYDVGSLLKVRAPFERLLEERRKGVQIRFQPKVAGQSFISRKGGIGGQSELSIEFAKQGVLVKPAVTLKEMLSALLEFEREGIEKKDMGTMLFAGEAEKSIGLLALLSQRYDVVVMNPPYGDMSKSTKDYAREHYPRTHYDYYAAFIEQAVDLCEKNGFVGMLTGRTFMFLKWFKRVRTEILLKEARSEILFDLNSSPGDNILDEATGRWAATVARRISNDNENSECIFIRLILFEGEDKKIEALEKGASSWLEKGENDTFFSIRLKDLKKLPGMPYSYWVPEGLAKLFEDYPPLDRDNAKKPDKAKITDLKVGLQTGNDARFTRYWWEVPTEEIAICPEDTFKRKKWVPFVKGIGRFYSDLSVVVNWEFNGRDLKKFNGSVIRNEECYFRPGLWWSNIVSSVFLDTRILPNGTIFRAGAHALFPRNEDHLWQLLSFTNSSLVAFLFLSLDPTMHNRHIGYVSQIPISSKILESEKLKKISYKLYNVIRTWETGNETSPLFLKPWILQFLQNNKDEELTARHSLSKNFMVTDRKWAFVSDNLHGSADLAIHDLIKYSLSWEEFVKKKICESQRLIDNEVYEIYSISRREQELVRQELAQFSGSSENLNDYEASIRPGVSGKEHVARYLSYCVKKIMEKDPEGIMITEELVSRVREFTKKDFGKHRLQRVESDIAQVLEKSVLDWLAEDFFEFHVGLYERRPIIWHMTSANFSSKRGIQGAFNCFLHYPKLRKDTIFKIRTRDEYLKGVLRGAKWKTQRLRRELQETRDSRDNRRERRLQEEYEKSLDELNELQAFDNKLAEVSNPRDKLTELSEDASWVDRKISEVKDNGWNPVLDYGVRVNIEPLKEAELLHRAAYRVK